jgi:DNA mismatch endonuclease (patch repair protein)
MVDRLTPERRSANMRQIKSKGMKPERHVRSIIYAMGYRYRLHRADLPGTPDLVFQARRKIIMVHGCFWHGHDDSACTVGRRQPKSNLEYWLPKLARNKRRDLQQEAELLRLGWSVLIIWECETRNDETLRQRLKVFLQ